MKKYTIDTQHRNDCPECDSDEYLLSEDGETFLCASCGFYTQEYSKDWTVMYVNKVLVQTQPNSQLCCLIH
ncbi:MULTISPECIES: hypothetical protein [Vibrio]|uniref:hypothetical protein n=1 Tax=Vibrio TaxID=662 RepID=UPI003D1230ED